MAAEKHITPLEVDGKVRRIRPLPKRKANAASPSPYIAFAGEQGLNPTRFTFATPPLVPAISALPPSAISITMTAIEIEKLLAEKDKIARRTEQDPALKMYPAMMEEKLEPDGDKKDDIGGAAAMMVKSEENLDMMVVDSTTPADDVAVFEEPVVDDGVSAEVQKLRMKIQALEQDKLDMAEKMKRMEDQLIAATSLQNTEEISDANAESPLISSPPEEKSGAEPLASVFARTADMPREDRKKALFESQRFTKEDLPEEGDAEFAANVLEIFAQEFDEKRKIESLPEPPVPVTRTAWRAQNGLTRGPQPPSPPAAKPSIFSYKKFIGFLCLLLAFGTALIYPYGGHSFKFLFNTSPNYNLTTSIETLNTANEPVYNEPTCLTWSNGSSELNDMVTCFACEEPVADSPSMTTQERQEIVYKHNPLFPVPNSVWVGYQWTKAAWKGSELYEHLFTTCDDLVFAC
ncbi:hypothetical protein DL98DRAFT_533399 [Cadophora sp. DSE1049]|nr:hypothetical protein DL98DRAFT_533399 [Cadophora sp. DSE1049]